MSKRTIVIGDVHGCFQELLALLAKLQWQPSSDRVIFVGDLVGKGPETLNVLKFCRENRFEVVKGNFEDNWLKWKREGRQMKPASDVKVAQSLSAADWQWMDSLPTWIRLPDFNSIIVHGGLVPNVPLEKQDAWMCMNVRCINAEGKPTSEFTTDDRLWARHYRGPEHVIFGHDAVRLLQRCEFATGIDTGCVYGGKLTALCLPSRELVQVDAKRQYSVPVSKM